MRENTALIQSLILMLYTLLITNTTLHMKCGVLCVSSSCLKHVFVCVVTLFLYFSLAYLMATSCRGFSCVTKCCVVFEVSFL